MSLAKDRFKTEAYRYQPVDQAQNVRNKRRLIDIMRALVEAPLEQLDDVLRDGLQSDATINVTHPINELSNRDSIAAQLWRPLRHALPDVERRNHIVAAGRYRDGDWIGCCGAYVGTFENDWLGIHPTRGVVTVRFAEGHHLLNGKIAMSYLFIDFLDLMRQVGYWPLAPSLGREMVWLPPMTHDGVLLNEQHNAVSQRTIERVLRMHAALGRYNQESPTRAILDEMKMVDHWHPNFMWYGPAGIGTTRGLRGFEDYHQIPFLAAFPDRGGSDLGHFIRIGDGNYAVTGGWGYLRMTHSGPGFLGLAPTGKEINMRVMDFYRCDEETIVENWVPIDIAHALLQIGVDIFGRMQHQFRQHQPLRSGNWLVR